MLYIKRHWLLLIESIVRFCLTNTEMQSQEDTAEESESTAVQEKTPIMAEESKSPVESQTVAAVQTKPAKKRLILPHLKSQRQNHLCRHPSRLFRKNKRSIRKNRQLPNQGRSKSRQRSRQNRNQQSRKTDIWCQPLCKFRKRVTQWCFPYFFAFANTLLKRRQKTTKKAGAFRFSLFSYVKTHFIFSLW